MANNAEKNKPRIDCIERRVHNISSVCVCVVYIHKYTLYVHVNKKRDKKYKRKKNPEEEEGVTYKRQAIHSP